jgi:tRNA-splicing ligase RtcB
MARAARNAEKAREAAAEIANQRPQDPKYQNSILRIFGQHDEATLQQMRTCMAVGNAVAGVICADGHLGYAQPVGGVIGYYNQISISGVGYDIGCGNLASKTDVKFETIKDQLGTILNDITSQISFGVGRKAKDKVGNELFDDLDAWQKAGMEQYRQKAISQFTTVGGGNHYEDVMVDEEGWVWLGNHFGSRGTGHTVATEHMKLNGGKDGMHVAPAIVDVDSERGERYLAAMQLGGRIAMEGRSAVHRIIAGRILGAHIVEEVHNHHNYAWKEKHVINGVEHELWVVRKGATPSRPGQRSFVGGSMGDDAVILEGLDTPEARESLYSTIHGAGRVFSRKAALKTFTRAQMDDWLRARGVLVSGGDLDESPQAYRRLPDVLAYHLGSVKVLHTLRPVAVAMAGRGEFDPWKD